MPADGERLPWVEQLCRGTCAAALPRRARDPRLLNLRSNELQHPWLDAILSDALRGLTTTALSRYPALGEARARVARRFGVTDDCVLLTAGSDAAIGLTIDALARPAGALVLQAPAYDAWLPYAALRALPVRVAPLFDEHGRASLAPLWAAARRCRDGVVSLANPNGTTGIAFPLDAVRELADDLATLGHLLVIDECYASFAGLRHAELSRRSPNVLVVHSFSKDFGLAGVRIAAVIGDSAVVEHLGRFGVEGPVSGAAVAMLGRVLEREPEFAAMWDDVGRWRDALGEAIAALDHGWRRLPSAANFVAVDVGADRPARLVELLHGAGILVRGLHVAPPGVALLRVTVGAPASMRAIRDALAGILARERSAA